MRVTAALFVLVLITPLRAFSQTAEPQRTIPTISVVAGVGNAMGVVGVQAERYVKNGRFSLFGGVGYSPETEPGPPPPGVAVAAGVRGFSRGLTHRAFVEVSVSELGIETARFGTEIIDGSRVYGPGAQVGYQHVTRGGLTGLVSIGVGFPVGAESDTGVLFMGGLGLGYTWR